ncbi:MAG: iron-containing redox enzyme family protein [Sandaracinaceae bacterium]
MTREQFIEALLQVMEQKHHWAWPKFTSGEVDAAKLHIHLEQEYAVYVRDFPVLVARAYVQCPIAAVRRALAENIYEEETGGLVAGRPHPELFLEYPRGLGMDLARFDAVELLPGARAYRDVLDHWTEERGWSVAAAVTTIFLEGTPEDRAVLDPSFTPSPPKPLEQHPLVVHYGLPLESLALTKAHRAVEGNHRKDAWEVMQHHVPEASYELVLGAMQETLTAWHGYRDDVAAAVGLTRD